MPGGISGLFKNTRGAISAQKAKYEKEAKALARRWNISLEKAFDTIMKRIDKGLPPLPDCCKKSKEQAPSRRKSAAKELPTSKDHADAVAQVAAAKELLENCIKDEIGTAVAAQHYDLPHSVKETIELIEILMERNNIPRVPAFLISQALRYIMRVGVKTPDWGKDIAKAENYLHRALTGKWNTGK